MINLTLALVSPVVKPVESVDVNGKTLD